MTPLVDLSFLLISFFIFTTTMQAPGVTRLLMPRQDAQHPSPIKASQAFTVLLGSHNKVFVYAGNWQQALQNHNIYTTGYDTYKGIGMFIREKQKELGPEREKMTMMIKPLRSSTYKNLIDMLDETSINLVTRYAIVEATSEEKAFVASQP